jgi:hypothetical protein
MYLGQLFPVDDYRTFGCYSNTHNKTIVVCDGDADSAGVKQLILALNSAMVGATQNPFQPVGAPLVSQSLDRVVHQIVQAFNKRKP